MFCGIPRLEIVSCHYAEFVTYLLILYSLCRVRGALEENPLICHSRILKSRAAIQNRRSIVFHSFFPFAQISSGVSHFMIMIHGCMAPNFLRHQYCGIYRRQQSSNAKNVCKRVRPLVHFPADKLISFGKVLSSCLIWNTRSWLQIVSSTMITICLIPLFQQNVEHKDRKGNAREIKIFSSISLPEIRRSMSGY